MKNTRKNWVWIFILCLFAAELTMSLNTINVSAKKQKQKLIVVCFDDSNSMIRDDKNINNFSQARWLKAIYAVNALSHMMNEGDKLKIYKFSDTIGEEIERVKDSDKDPVGDQLKKYLVNTKYPNSTPANKGVKQAKEYLKKDEFKEYDKHLIVISDGVFTPKGTNINDVIKPIDKVKISYVGIGDNVKYPEKGDNIKNYEYDDYNKNGNDKAIIEEIACVVNDIYGRIDFDKAFKEEFIKPKDGQTIINFDIPVSEVTLFYMTNGKESIPDMIENIGSNWEIDKEPIINRIEKDEIKNLTCEEKGKLEPRKVGEDPKLQKIVDEISYTGKIIKYIAKDEDNGTTNSIQIPFECKLDNLYVYYKPVIDSKVQVTSTGDTNDGKPRELDFNSETKLGEGYFTFTMVYYDKNGKALDSGSKLLKADNGHWAIENTENKEVLFDKDNLKEIGINLIKGDGVKIWYENESTDTDPKSLDIKVIEHDFNINFLESKEDCANVKLNEDGIANLRVYLQKLPDNGEAKGEVISNNNWNNIKISLKNKGKKSIFQLGENMEYSHGEEDNAVHEYYIDIPLQLTEKSKNTEGLFNNYNKKTKSVQEEYEINLTLNREDKDSSEVTCSENYRVNIYMDPIDIKLKDVITLAEDVELDELMNNPNGFIRPMELVTKGKFKIKDFTTSILKMEDNTLKPIGFYKWYHRLLPNIYKNYLVANVEELSTMKVKVHFKHWILEQEEIITIHNSIKPINPENRKKYRTIYIVLMIIYGILLIWVILEFINFFIQPFVRNSYIKKNKQVWTDSVTGDFPITWHGIDKVCFYLCLSPNRSMNVNIVSNRVDDGTYPDLNFKLCYSKKDYKWRIKNVEDLKELLEETDYVLMIENYEISKSICYFEERKNSELRLFLCKRKSLEKEMQIYIQ